MPLQDDDGDTHEQLESAVCCRTRWKRMKEISGDNPVPCLTAWTEEQYAPMLKSSRHGPTKMI